MDGTRASVTGEEGVAGRSLVQGRADTGRPRSETAESPWLRRNTPVNVLFLLLTSVSASQAPVIPAASPAPAPVVSTPIPGGCGAGGGCSAGGCGATCDS